MSRSIVRRALLMLLLGSVACGPSLPPAAPAPSPEAGPTVDVPGRHKPRSATYPESPERTLGPGLPAGEADALGRSVVGTAREAMGRPYRLGGRGADGGGFDCSGLIQFAYGEHGIALPRVSVDQARSGVGIPREVEQLLPGDLLTFSKKPGSTQVSHIGMYVGDGRFIHSSSSKGVRESALDEKDPDGRWWMRRWVGARRVLGY